MVEHRDTLSPLIDTIHPLIACVSPPIFGHYKSKAIVFR